jgi:hypothetical protein
MKIREFCQSICVLSAVVFLTAGAASAQQKKIEIFRGGKVEGGSEKNVIPGKITRSGATSKTEAPETNSTSVTQPKATPAPRYSAESQERIRSTSLRLVNGSFDSFQRGLMPLHDHLEQLQLAAEADFRLAGKAGQGAVAARHLERMRRVELALREFDAPNAEGWRADLFLSQALVAQAEYELALTEQNAAVADFAAQRARTLAERHLIERRYDSSVGLASLPTLLQAEMLTPDGAARGRELLVEAVRQTRRWNQLGAGIGRSDKLAEAEFELARFDFFTAFDSESQDIEASFTAASEASAKVLTQRIEFYKNGTASLYDIARSWWNMRELVEYAASTKTGVSQEAIEQSRANLEQVVEMATAKEDRQGRIAADIAYVSLLNDIATAK